MQVNGAFHSVEKRRVIINYIIPITTCSAPNPYSLPVIVRIWRLQASCLIHHSEAFLIGPQSDPNWQFTSQPQLSSQSIFPLPRLDHFGVGLDIKSSRCSCLVMQKCWWSEKKGWRQEKPNDWREDELNVGWAARLNSDPCRQWWELPFSRLKGRHEVKTVFCEGRSRH